MPTENIITAATKLAKESGTFSIEVSFEDEEGTALTPDTLYWNLVDEDNNIINSRENVELTPDSTVTITLSGDDLPAVENANDTYVHLWLVVHGTYTSDLGSNLPFQDQVRFSVEPIKGDT